jgi:hypothetical protein
MAFGNPVTDGERVAIGTYGYVLKFNLKPQEPAAVTRVQLQLSATNALSTPSTTPSTMDTVFSLPSSTQTAVDFAWVATGNTVYVFVRTAVYAFVSTTRIAFWLMRNAMNVVLTSDEVDVPQEARPLLVRMCQELLCLVEGRRVPFEVQDAVRAEKARLGI